ncbi:MAG: MmcQ/YjbR family DNA-binding protein [Burkholderiales bacterium]|jgi:hypothetical protein|nr:MmcQ/YjbR family DNA-binding protein [Burkholderiales bacterium]
MKAEQARALALGLPGAVEKPHHELTSFRLPGTKPGTTGSIFATMTPDGAELRVFIKNEDSRDAWIAREAGAVESLLWGGKRRGVRVWLAKAKPGWVTELLAEAWRDLGGA